MALIKIKQVDDLQTELDGLSTNISVAESDAISAAGSLDTVLETALEEYADSAESDAISAAGSLDTILETALEEYADSAESDAISAANSHADSLDTVMDGRVTTLEDTILADDEFRVEEFTGGTGVAASANSNFDVTVSADVQNDREALVWAFVNGVRVTVVSAAGKVVTLNAAYDVDDTDVITIQYQSVDT